MFRYAMLHPFLFIESFGGHTGLMTILDSEVILERNHHQVHLLSYWKYPSILNFVYSLLKVSI